MSLKWDCTVFAYIGAIIGTYTVENWIKNILYIKVNMMVLQKWFYHILLKCVFKSWRWIVECTEWQLSHNDDAVESIRNQIETKGFFFPFTFSLYMRNI